MFCDVVKAAPCRGRNKIIPRSSITTTILKHMVKLVLHHLFFLYSDDIFEIISDFSQLKMKLVTDERCFIFLSTEDDEACYARAAFD